MFARMGYGIAAQRAVKRGPAGGDYALRLKQVGRPIGIATRRGDNGRCIATARTSIGGVVAELSSIYVKLNGPLSVEYVEVKGRDFRDRQGADRTHQALKREKHRVRPPRAGTPPPATRVFLWAVGIRGRFFNFQQPFRRARLRYLVGRHCARACQQSGVHIEWTHAC